MSGTSLPDPEPNTRFVTGHTDDGTAVFIHSGAMNCGATGATEDPNTGKHVLMSVPWQTFTSRPDNSSKTAEDCSTDGSGPLANDTGSTCRVVYYPPRSVTPMHRTTTLDYGILVSGKMDLELDNDERKEIKPGDVVVQRGTIHRWHNTSDEWAQMVYVLIAAEKLVINDEEMKPEFRV